jgi:molybdopterin synthase sulfur carrier subunit
VVDVEFARALRPDLEWPAARVRGATVRAVLDAYFELHPQVRGYVVDEAGAVRRHVAVFRNADLITDRAGLSDPVADGDRLHVFQALSGG